MNHNKKRNTAFLYEALTKEIAKCELEEDKERKHKAKRLLEEFFAKDTLLRKDLEIYKSIYETEGVMPHIADKIIQESKKRKRNLDNKKLFDQQSRLLNKIDKDLDQSVYSNFIPNYKSLATIYQVLNVDDIKANKQVLLEDKLTGEMVKEKDSEPEELEPMDRLSYLKFVEKFNEKYSDKLIAEQKELLSKYIYSMDDDNRSDFKVYLNRELGRLKRSLNEALDSYEGFEEDPNMKKKAEEVLEELESFSKKQDLEKEEIHKIMKTQELLGEIENG